MVEQWRNFGIYSLNQRQAKEEASTIIVLGVSRSGTSMVAAILDSLGVYLGTRLDRAVFEDQEIARALEKEPSSLVKIIERNNAAHELWGFKRPLAYKTISPYLHHFRNPRFIITFRDVLAVALRNTISTNAVLRNSLIEVARLTGELIDFVKDLSAPALLISYEKALADPARAVEAIVDFCGIEATLDQKSLARSKIVNGPEIYLKSSRVRWEGYLDRVDTCAHGWARLPFRGKPATVVLKIDGVEIGRGLADKPRPDLAAEEKGDAAFSIPLPEQFRSSTKVEAYIEDDPPRLLPKSRGLYPVELSAKVDDGMNG